MLSVAAEKPPSDGLMHSLGRALEHDRRRRNSNRRPQVTIDKAEVKRRDRQFQEAARLEDKITVNALVTKEARQHSEYQAVRFELIEVTEGGKRVKKETKVVRNVGRTAIDRWVMRGQLDDRQLAAILFYQSAFRAVFGEGPRVTANYSPDVIRGADGSMDRWLLSVQSCKTSLILLDDEVFRRLPRHYKPVWQNVVIWDEAAGVAGSRAGYVNKPAEAVAKEIVKTVAHMVADLVIDARRKRPGGNR